MSLRVPPAPGRQRTYPVSTMKLAQSMAAGGWSPTEIQRALRRDGKAVPTRTTIIGWTTPDYAERQREKSRRKGHLRSVEQNGGRLAVGRRSDVFKAARIKALRIEGMSCSAIAKVMSFDFPDDPVTEHQVRYLLRQAA